MENGLKVKVVELTIDSNGRKAWFQNGKTHRDNDQPAVIYSNGSKRWYQNDKCIKREVNSLEE